MTIKKEDEGESGIQETIEGGSSPQARVILDLPISIWVEIFRRLPIKTVLWCSCVCKTFSKVLEVGEYRCESRFTVKPVRARAPPNEGKLYILVSSKGLLCLAETFPAHMMPRFIYICNPILGEYSELPLGKIKDIPVSYGFGFYPSSDDYKVGCKSFGRKKSS